MAFGFTRRPQRTGEIEFALTAARFLTVHDNEFSAIRTVIESVARSGDLIRTKELVSTIERTDIMKGHQETIAAARAAAEVGHYEDARVLIHFAGELD